jgi:hypothetical protein
MTPYTKRFTVSKYTVYQGKFKCQVCNAEVTSLRHYATDKLITWLCSEKHLSEVSLKPKTKKDYEREV